MRALAEETKGRISRHMMRRIAEDYERFAQTVEQRPHGLLPPSAVVPAEVRRFGLRKESAGAPPRSIPDFEIPGFLRRGPATADDVGASAATGK
jgi:hypothetical protein